MSVTLPTFYEQRYAFTEATKPRTRSAGSAVTKIANVLYIPAFSIESTWRGASEIIAKYNFSLGSKLSFPRITKIGSPNFCPCISWKPTSETIVRYKLWQDIGEILYVPLYSGQTANADFAIEIWNTPNNITDDGVVEGGVFVSESGDILITEAGEQLTSEQESAQGLPTVLCDNAGLHLLRSSKLSIPTTPFCQTSANSLGSDYEDCTDLIFELQGAAIGDYKPIDGDYYNVIEDCGVTELVKASRFVGDEIILQCAEDLTWHRMYLTEIDSILYLVVDQANAAESEYPHVVLKALNGITNYKMDIELRDGIYHRRIYGDAESDLDFHVLYLSYNSNYYAVRMYLNVGIPHIQLSDTALSL